MKITLVNNLYSPYTLGGGGKSVQLLAEGLSRIGHKVSVITLTPENDNRTLEINGISIHQLPLKNLYWPFSGEGHRRFLRPLFNLWDRTNRSMARLLSETLDEIDPDLVHTNNLYGFSTSVWRAVKQKELLLVHTLRDYYLNCLHANLMKNKEVCQKHCWDCSLWSRSRRKRSQAVDGVVGVSRFILKKHRTFGFFEGVADREIIHNPLPAEIPEHLTTELNQKKSDIRLGYLGRLAPEKGIEHLLEILDQSKLELKIFVAGSGVHTYEKKLRNRFSGEEVQFLGYVEPSELFEKIDLLVVPSLWPDPLPRVIYESYQHGVPVIVTNRGGSPEIVDEGETGWVYDATKPESLTGILHSIQEDPNQLVDRKQGVREKAKRFQPSKIVHRYLQFYRQVANG